MQNRTAIIPLSFLTQLLIQAKKRGMGFPSIVAVAELREIDDTSLSKWHLSFHLAVWVPSNISLGFLYCGLKAAKFQMLSTINLHSFFFLEECLDITSTDPQNNYCSKVFQELKNLKVHSILYFSTKHLMGKKNTPSDIIYAST